MFVPQKKKSLHPWLFSHVLSFIAEVFSEASSQNQNNLRSFLNFDFATPHILPSGLVCNYKSLLLETIKIDSYLTKTSWAFGDMMLEKCICLQAAAVIHSHQRCWNLHSYSRLDETPALWLLMPPKIHQNQLNKESISTFLCVHEQKREIEREQVVFLESYVF